MRFLLILLLGSALVWSAPGAGLEPVALAPSVYAFYGDPGEATWDNAGNTGNTGFIIGRDGVIVVDTGISYRHGQAILEALARTTDKPVQLAIITHGVQEFLFGNAAFAERGVPLLAHARSVELMRSRCEHCLENLRVLLGDAMMRGTRVVLPERTVEASMSLEVAGRKLDLLTFGWGATPGDLVVFDRSSGVLFAGGLLTVQRIPDLRDGKLDGWLAALDRLEQVPARVLVPGHGPAATPAAIGELRDYLLALDAQARQFYGSGLSLMQALDAAELPAYRHWAMYPTLHRRNVQQRYLELELEELERVSCQGSVVSCQ